MKTINRRIVAWLAGGAAAALLSVGCGGGGDGAGAGGTSTPTATEVLQNPGFEAPAQSDGTLARVTASAWSGGAALTNPSASGAVAGNFFTWPQPAEGVQYADIGNVPATALRQRFTVTTAGTYRLTWKDNTGLNIVPGFRTSPYTVALTDAAGSQIYSAPFDAWRESGAWETRTVDRAFPAGTFTLTFTSQGTTGNGTDTLIDDVSLKQAA